MRLLWSLGNSDRECSAMDVSRVTYDNKVAAAEVVEVVMGVDKLEGCSVCCEVLEFCVKRS